MSDYNADDIAALMPGVTKEGVEYRCGCPCCYGFENAGNGHGCSFKDGHSQVVFNNFVCRIHSSEDISRYVARYMNANSPPHKNKKAQGGNPEQSVNKTVKLVTATADDLIKPKPHIPQLTDAEIKGPWYYADADGNQLIRVRRSDLPNGKKAFPTNGWKDGAWQKSGATPSVRPLYCLPVIHFENKPVLVVEGEKACHGAMHQFPDYSCTTWCQGKGNWTKTDWSPIARRMVVIWPDKDALKEMDKLALHLHSLGCTVYLVDVSTVPDGYDLANPIPNARDLVDSAVKYTPAPIETRFNIISSTDLMKMDFPETRWVAEDFIPEGCTLLAAPPKIGKSFFCELLAACVATGRDFLGKPTTRTKVLYIDAEQSNKLIQKRLRAIGWDQGAVGLDTLSMPGIMLDKHVLENELTPIIKANGYGLIVLDTMARLLPRPKGGGDAYQNASEMIGPFHTWCKELNLNALVVHHTRKTQADESAGESHDTISGGYGFAAVVDTIVTFRRQTKDLFKVSVTGRIEEAQTYAVEKDGALWVMKGDFEEECATEERRQILEAIRDLGGKDIGVSEICDFVGKERSNVGHILKKMSAGSSPLVIRTGTSKKYLYSLPE